MISSHEPTSDQALPVAESAPTARQLRRRRGRVGGCVSWLAVSIVLLALVGALAVLAVLMGERHLR